MEDKKKCFSFFKKLFFQNTSVLTRKNKDLNSFTSQMKFLFFSSFSICLSLVNFLFPYENHESNIQVEKIDNPLSGQEEKQTTYKSNCNEDFIFFPKTEFNQSLNAIKCFLLIISFLFALGCLMIHILTQRFLIEENKQLCDLKKNKMHGNSNENKFYREENCKNNLEKIANANQKETNNNKYSYCNWGSCGNFSCNFNTGKKHEYNLSYFLKKYRIRFNILILFFLLVNNILQFQILKSQIEYELNYSSDYGSYKFHLNFSIPFSSCLLIVTSLVFFDSDIIVVFSSFLTSGIFLYVFSIGENWKAGFRFIYLIFFISFYSIFAYSIQKSKYKNSLKTQQMKFELENLSNIIENLNSGFITCGSECNFIYNKKFFKILNSIKEEISSNEPQNTIITEAESKKDFLLKIILDDSRFESKFNASSLKMIKEKSFDGNDSVKKFSDVLLFLGMFEPNNIQYNLEMDSEITDFIKTNFISCEKEKAKRALILLENTEVKRNLSIKDNNIKITNIQPASNENKEIPVNHVLNKKPSAPSKFFKGIDNNNKKISNSTKNVGISNCVENLHKKLKSKNHNINNNNGNNLIVKIDNQNSNNNCANHTAKTSDFYKLDILKSDKTVISKEFNSNSNSINNSNSFLLINNSNIKINKISDKSFVIESENSKETKNLKSRYSNSNKNIESNKEDIEEFLFEKQIIFENFISMVKRKLPRDKFVHLLTYKNKFNARRDGLNILMYIRFNHHSGKIEFLMDDLTQVVKTESINVENKTKKKFLKKFSHEFRNPILNIIQLVKNSKKFEQEEIKSQLIKKNFLTKTNSLLMLSNTNKNAFSNLLSSSYEKGNMNVYKMNSNNKIDKLNINCLARNETELNNFGNDNIILIEKSNKNLISNKNLGIIRKRNLKVNSKPSNSSLANKFSYMKDNNHILRNNKCSGSRRLNSNQASDSSYCDSFNNNENHLDNRSSHKNLNKYLILKKNENKNIQKSDDHIIINKLTEQNKINSENKIILELTNKLDETTIDNFDHIKYLCYYMNFLINDFDFIVKNENNPDESGKNLNLGTNYFSNIYTKRSSFGLSICNAKLQSEIQVQNMKGNQDPKGFSVKATDISKKETKLNVKPSEELIKNIYSQVEIQKIVKKMVKIFKSKIILADKKVDLMLHIDENVPETIISSLDKINQILFNLISNSFKFTKFGIIRVTVRCLSKSKIEFEIFDTGIGIKNDFLKTIFEPYFKLKDKSNNLYGIGLGLHVVKTNVMELGGSIFIESQENQHTKIKFYILYEEVIAAENYFDNFYNINKKVEEDRDSISRSTLDYRVEGKDETNIRLKLKTIKICELKNPASKNPDKLHMNKIKIDKNKTRHEGLTNEALVDEEKILYEKELGKTFYFKNKTDTLITNKFEYEKSASKILERGDLQKNVFDSFRIKSGVSSEDENKNVNRIRIRKLSSMIGVYSSRNSIFSIEKSSFSGKRIEKRLVRNRNSISKIVYHLEPWISQRVYAKSNSDSRIQIIENKSDTNDLEINSPTNQSIAGTKVHKSYSNKISYKMGLNRISNKDVKKYIVKKNLTNGHKDSDVNYTIDNKSNVDEVNESNKHISCSRYKNNNNNLKYEDKNTSIINNNECNKFLISLNCSYRDNISLNTNYYDENLNFDYRKYGLKSDIKNFFIKLPESNNINIHETDKKNSKSSNKISSKFVLDSKQVISDDLINGNSSIRGRKKLNLSSRSNINISHLNTNEIGSNNNSLENKINFVSISGRSHALYNNEKRKKEVLMKKPIRIKNKNKFDSSFHKLNISDNNKNTEIRNHIKFEGKKDLKLLYSKTRKIKENENLNSTFDNKSFINNNLQDNNGPNRNRNANQIIKTIRNTNDKRTIRFLIVDDERLIRQSNTNLIRKYFKNKNVNIEIVECEDGFECLEAIYKFKKKGINFDYVITDQTMNYITGAILCQILNILIENKIINSIKIYLLTSYSTDNFLSKSFKFNFIFSKPLIFQHLDYIFQNNTC